MVDLEVGCSVRYGGPRVRIVRKIRSYLSATPALPNIAGTYPAGARCRYITGCGWGASRETQWDLQRVVYKRVSFSMDVISTVTFPKIIILHEKTCAAKEGNIFKVPPPTNR